MNNNTKTIALTLLATSIIAAGVTFAANTTSTGVTNIFNKKQELSGEQKQGFGFGKKGGCGMRGGRGGEMMGFGFDEKGGFLNDLTAEEKTKLETMTSEEKKVFFENKRNEFEIKQEAKENVIDKVLSGSALTQEEETLKQEIIKQRAELKQKRLEMKEFRTLMDKQRNGETLTTVEQTKLDDLKSKLPQGKGRGFDRD